jgi:hypothetical protein
MIYLSTINQQRILKALQLQELKIGRHFTSY